MKDPFSYSARWDSVGLDCAFCIHEKQVEWPDTKRDYSCLLHGVSLVATLAKNGFKEGEWFCSAFESNGKTNERAIIELEAIKHELAPDILYGAYGKDGNLKEIPFSDL